MLRCTVDTLEETARREGVTKTALIIVGRILEGGYERSKLYDPSFTTEFRKAVTRKNRQVKRKMQDRIRTEKGRTAMSKIYVTGLGPGAKDQMTIRARKVLEHCPVIIGYTVYIDLIRDQFPDKQYLSTPMRREADRCRMAFEEAEKDRTWQWCAAGTQASTAWRG